MNPEELNRYSDGKKVEKPDPIAVKLDQEQNVIDENQSHPHRCNMCGRGHSTDEDCYIPQAPYYVTVVDSFMSDVTGKDDLCVVPCANQSEARAVYAYLKNREQDMKMLRVVTGKPKQTRFTNRRICNLMSWRRLALKRANALEAAGFGREVGR